MYAHYVLHNLLTMYKNPTCDAALPTFGRTVLKVTSFGKPLYLSVLTLPIRLYNTLTDHWDPAKESGFICPLGKKLIISPTGI